MVRAAAVFVLGIAAAFLSGCEQQQPRNASVTIWAFGSTGCRQCVMDKPALNAIAQRFNVYEFDEGRGGFANHQIDSLPTYIIKTNDAVGGGYREVFRTGDINELARTLGYQ